MLRRSCASRLPLLLATAIVAAALGDAFVETIANSGAIGRGYADHNHLSVIPTLIAGVCLLIIVAGMRCAHLLRRTREQHCVAARSPLLDAACVFALQLGALFVMETVERIAYGGHAAFGTAWLGGPVWFSLLAHAALAYGCTVTASRFAHSAANGCAVLLAIALRSLSTATGGGALPAARRIDAAFLAAQRLCVRSTGERAPPVLSAPFCSIH